MTDAKVECEAREFCDVWFDAGTLTVQFEAMVVATVKLLQGERNAALEEAAKVAEHFALASNCCGSPAYATACRDVADAIRALKVGGV